jgi:hypothetical protein
MKRINRDFYLVRDCDEYGDYHITTQQPVFRYVGEDSNEYCSGYDWERDFTALASACYEGFEESAPMLALNPGEYRRVRLSNKKPDSPKKKFVQLYHHGNYLSSDDHANMLYLDSKVRLRQNQTYYAYEI